MKRAIVAFALLCAALCLQQGQPAPAEEKGGGADAAAGAGKTGDGDAAAEGEKPPAAVKSEPEAEEAFKKAAAWQGKPSEPQGSDKVSTLQIQELLFKSYGSNELEGTFQVLHTAPDKVYFKIMTPSWWRAYRSDGRDFWWKTGAMSGGWEKLSEKNKDHAEKTDLIKAALRIVRLLFLQNFLDGKTSFIYLGEQTLTRAGKEFPPADLVKCCRSGEDSVLFYLGKRGGTPVCIVVHQFLNMYHPDRDFFIYLEDYRRFNGVMLPTKIKIFLRHLASGLDEKFLFCQLVDDQTSKVRVNQPIPSLAYKGD